jgi:hypothetical protein
MGGYLRAKSYLLAAGEKTNTASESADGLEVQIVPGIMKSRGGGGVVQFPAAPALPNTSKRALILCDETRIF